MNDIKKQLNNLKIEDFIWIVYIFISIAALYSNELERDYIINNNKNSNRKFHNINALILTTAFFIYLYFVYKNYKNISNLRDNISNKKHFDANLLLISSILFLVAGSITLYVELTDNQEDEIGII